MTARQTVPINPHRTEGTKIMARITIRFDASEELREELRTAWLEDEGITIHTAAGAFSVDLTYVKEG